MSGKIVIALATFPDAEVARKIVHEIIDVRLAACGNILEVQSIYRWQGKVESNPEAMVVFKLTADCYPEFETKLRSLHPYDVPEIICMNVERGLPEYLRWVAENCEH